MDLREISWGVCAVGSPGTGQGLLVGCCEGGDEPSGSGATELVGWLVMDINYFKKLQQSALVLTFRACEI
jgi:hypothetical protein